MSLPSLFSRKKEAYEKNINCSTEEKTKKTSHNVTATHCLNEIRRGNTEMRYSEPYSRDNKQAIRLPDINSCVANKKMSEKENGSLKLPRVGNSKQFLVASQSNAETLLS